MTLSNENVSFFGANLVLLPIAVSARKLIEMASSFYIAKLNLYILFKFVCLANPWLVCPDRQNWICVSVFEFVCICICIFVFSNLCAGPILDLCAQTGKTVTQQFRYSLHICFAIGFYLSVNTWFEKQTNFVCFCKNEKCEYKFPGKPFFVSFLM